MATLLYDGTCGFCARWAAWAKMRGSPVAFVPCRDSNLAARAGLTNADCLRSAWWLATEIHGPVRRSGARAVCAVWKGLPGLRNLGWRFLGTVADLPVLRLGTDLLYRGVARVRHRLRGPGGDA